MWPHRNGGVCVDFGVGFADIKGLARVGIYIMMEGVGVGSGN